MAAESKNKSLLESIAIILSIISLVATIAVAYQSQITAQQANDLTKRSLELQIQQGNFSTTILPSSKQTTLDSLVPYSSFDAIYGIPANCRGWVNGSIIVITPSYGLLKVTYQNFSISNDFHDLDTVKINETQTTIPTGYSNGNLNSNQIVVPGVNQGLSFSIPLEVTFYPDFAKLPALSGSTVIFPIGNVNLKAEIESQDGHVFYKNFSVVVYVTLKT